MLFMERVPDALEMPRLEGFQNIDFTNPIAAIMNGDQGFDENHAVVVGVLSLIFSHQWYLVLRK